MASDLASRCLSFLTCKNRILISYLISCLRLYLINGFENVLNSFLKVLLQELLITQCPHPQNSACPQSLLTVPSSLPLPPQLLLPDAVASSTALSSRGCFLSSLLCTTWFTGRGSILLTPHCCFRFTFPLLKRCTLTLMSSVTPHHFILQLPTTAWLPPFHSSNI